MQKMTTDAYRAFIRQKAKTGTLATVRKDGRPHCVPIWCDFDGDAVLFTTMKNTVKAKNLVANNRVAITFDSESFPYDFVTVEGTAEVLDVTTSDLLRIATAIAARYVPQERAHEFGERNADPDELVIKVTPTKVISAKGVAS